MVAISQNSELYDKMFKGISLPDVFASRYPTYEDIANGFLDPSNKNKRLSQNHLNGDQTGDIRNASRFLVKDLSVTTGSSLPTNFPSFLLDGLFNIVQSADIDVSLTDNDVINKIMSNSTVPGNNKIGGVPGMVIGAGLLTLSVTVPLVGMIASAIIGIGAGIAKAIKTKGEKLEAEKEENRALLYKTFAPLQVAGSGSDSGLVNEMRDIFKSHDWTDIYAPRFYGEEWRGIERVGGFAFAPGSVVKDSSEFAADVDEKFNPSNGFGVIPGTDIVTSVIQVSLPHDKEDPLSGPFQKYMTKQEPNMNYGPDPRMQANAWSMVQDVGTYYPTTGRLGAAWWTIALQKGNWYKFRIDSKRLHEEWKDYCESGLRFIRDKCYKWNHSNFNLDSDLEGYFGSAIYYAIGAWAGRINGGDSWNPTYEKLKKPIGYTRDQMVRKKLYPGSQNSGAFLPLHDIVNNDGELWNKTWWCDSCLGSIYDRGYDIKSKLDDLRNRQIWDLYTSLASAYCSQNDAAFVNDQNLLKLLKSRRQILLKHSDRKKIDINDVLTDEPGLSGIKNSNSWKQQLLDSGVPLVLPKMSNFHNSNMKISFGDAPPNLTPPDDNIDVDPGPINPYNPNFKINRKIKSSGSTSNNGIILMAGVGAAAYFFLGR